MFIAFPALIQAQGGEVSPLVSSPIEGEARAFMDDYADDLRAGGRQSIADRYDKRGAYRVGEGQKVLERYRPFAAGMACAQAHSFSVDVNDGFLDVTFETTSQDFEVDHPMISAIEVQQEASTR